MSPHANLMEASSSAQFPPPKCVKLTSKISCRPNSQGARIEKACHDLPSKTRCEAHPLPRTCQFPSQICEHVAHTPRTAWSIQGHLEFKYFVSMLSSPCKSSFPLCKYLQKGANNRLSFHLKPRLCQSIHLRPALQLAST